MRNNQSLLCRARDAPARIQESCRRKYPRTYFLRSALVESNSPAAVRLLRGFNRSYAHFSYHMGGN